MFGNENAKILYSKKRIGMEDRKVGMLEMLGKVCNEMLGNTKEELEIYFLHQDGEKIGT